MRRRKLIFVLCLGVGLVLSTLTSCQNVSDLSGTVYLTWQQEDTSRFVTVNALVPVETDGVYVYYDTKAHQDLASYSFKEEMRAYDMPGNKNVRMSAQLKNLVPGQTYHFRFSFRDNMLEGEYKFRSLPLNTEEIRLVQGGDMGVSLNIPDISKTAMTREPHAILIGGDIAYADGKIEKSKNWEEWLKLMEEVMTTPEGFLVPMILAIGNHEVNGAVGSNISKAPFYFQLFPQNKSTSYFTRKLGSSAVLFVLDSGHIAKHGDVQAKWLEKELERHTATKFKMALYHVPLFPSNRSYNGKLSVEGRKAWLPLFEKYKLDLSFENHDHTLKRTKPLNTKGISTKATVFVGDGCWGRTTRSVNRDLWYIEKAESVHHVWTVAITPSKLKIEALGIGGASFDYFELAD